MGKRKESEEEGSQAAASKIQAGVRGYLVRKRQRVEREAATKIQAGFRGFKVRKEIKQGSSQPPSPQKQSASL